MGLKELIKKPIITYEDKKYRRKVSDAVPSFDRWIREKEKELERFDMTVELLGKDVAPGEYSNMSYATRYGATSIRIIPYSKIGQSFSLQHYIEDILIFVDGALTDKAIPLISKKFEADSEAAVCYGDEDIAEIDEDNTLKYGKSQYGTRREPYFKPAWSPNAFLSHFYFCNIVAIRRSAFRDFEWDKTFTGGKALYRNLLKYIFSEDSYRKDCVAFVDEILVHASQYDNNKITDEYSETLFSNGTFAVKMKDLSVVIPSKNNPDLLKSSIESFIKYKPEDLCEEFIIVDNGSTQEKKAEIEKLLASYNSTYIYAPMDFNFSAQCNIGVKEAKYDNILLLNDDIIFENSDSIAECIKQLGCSFSGAVGIKLRYPDTDAIQHAGVVNSTIGPVHKLQFLSDSREHYFGYNRYSVNVSAVTAACLFVRKDVYLQVGGLNEELKVAFNDVDFCYKLLEAGYVNVCCNNVYATHYESITRGRDTDVVSLFRLEKEKEILYNAHSSLKRFDPYYSKYLLTDCLDVRIVPANEYEAERGEFFDRKIKSTDLKSAREDMCVNLSVEYASKKSGFTYDEKDADSLYFQGFSYVSGSNNACYKKYILLQSDAETLYIPFEGIVRQDVALAIPDQKNVENSGFAVSVPAKAIQEAGTYCVGVLYVNKYARERLYSFSHKYLVVK